MGKCFTNMTILLISLGYLNVARAIDIEGKIHRAAMNTCNKSSDKCLSLSFTKAEMSHWSSLFAFNDYSLSFTTKNKLKDNIQYLQGKRGYFDFKMNTLLVVDDTSQKEILIDLKTLERKEFQL